MSTARVRETDMIGVLLSASDTGVADFQHPIEQACAARGLDVTLSPSLDPAQTDYIVCSPSGPVSDFSIFPKLRAVLSLWAGVEQLAPNPTLQVPLCRMVDPSLTQGMVEYVTGHVLHQHLGMQAQRAAQSERNWAPVFPSLAREKVVGILGLGALGRACADALTCLGFDVHGWSRAPKEISRITCHSGSTGLENILRASDILVTLLPATADTCGIVNARTLAWLKPSAFLINPGRGSLIDEDALLAALDSGHLAHATLDVFTQEPLPSDHPFWRHPKISITPHVAAATRADTAAEVIAENIVRDQAGQPLNHLVDRAAGY